MIAPDLRERILGNIASPDLHHLYDYWAARCKDGRLPARRDIDPLDLRALLGNLLLVDVLRDPLRFRYRLAGTNLVTHFGFDPTGRMVDEHPDPTFRKIALETYARVATTREPYSVKRDETLDGRLRRYETLLLPLASDGLTVDMVLGATRLAK